MVYSVWSAYLSVESDELGVDDLHLLGALEAPVHTLCRPSLPLTTIPIAFTTSLTTLTPASCGTTAAVSTDTTGVDVVIVIVRVFDLIVLIDSSNSLGQSLGYLVATTSWLLVIVVVIIIVVLVVVVVIIIMIVVVSWLAVLSELDLHTCV